MSTPSRSSQDREGASGIMNRMKSALKKGSGSRHPVSTAAPTESSRPAPTMRKSHFGVTVPALISNWSAVQQDRARVLFAKYGLTLEPGEWQSPANMTVQRIDRPIRMRVRRSCHRCDTGFGPDRICANCQHVRCKKCPRHPPPKNQDKADRSMTARAPRAKELEAAKKKPLLTLPSPSGGQDLVHKKPRQRVRRFCHMCNSKFEHHYSTECGNCKHTRCTKCPRDPPSLKKYPNGYPGDAQPPIERQERVWKKPRRRVRHICHKCSSHMRSSDKACSQCGQEKCDETIRQPPKKKKPEFDPEVVKSVQEKLANLKTTA